MPSPPSRTPAATPRTSSARRSRGLACPSSRPPPTPTSRWSAREPPHPVRATLSQARHEDDRSPPSVSREDNRHSEVEHPDAWAHRNLDELDRAYVTAVREMSTGAGGAGNERGAPALGCPLVWVCGYRCGTLAFGWMSTTHAWWPKSVGMLIAEATMTGVLTAVAAWAGAARPRMAAVSPLATTAANPNLFIVVPSSFYLLLCLSLWRELAVRRL